MPMPRRLTQVPIESLPDGRRRVVLTLWGPMPTKKNKLRPRVGAGRGHRYDERTTAELDALLVQARAAWGPRKPVRHPDVEIRIWAAYESQDRDGMWTTVLDVLVKARILDDDAIRKHNGREVKHPAEVVNDMNEQRIEVTFTLPQGAL